MWVYFANNPLRFLFLLCSTGLLSPNLPFPPQAPQGPMGFGQPRPPLMSYGGKSWDVRHHVLMNVSVWSIALFNGFSTGGLPYPPNQFGGGGRGNYDNFRGQGGYLGKPRNMRWEPCTCDLYFIIKYLRFDTVKFWAFFYFFSSLGTGLFPPWTINHIRMSRGDPRNIIEYRDLDAPDDMDFF